MKQQQKTTVTLAMVWIGAMMLASTPGWIRGAIGFVNGASTSSPKTVVSHGGAASSSGGSGAMLTP